MLYNGTVGYNWMTVPFTICGVLTFIYAVTAAYFAATHNLVRHRAWAIRAFFIGNASPSTDFSTRSPSMDPWTIFRLALLPRTDGIG